MSLVEEAETPEDSGEALPVSLAEVSEVVKKLLSSKALGVDEIHPEILKGLDIVGLSCLTRLFSVVWSACGVADRGGGSHLQKVGPEGVCQLSGYHTAQPPWESLHQGAGKEAPTDCQTSDPRGAMQIPSWPWNSGPDLYPRKTRWIW